MSQGQTGGNSSHCVAQLCKCRTGCSGWPLKNLSFIICSAGWLAQLVGGTSHFDFNKTFSTTMRRTLYIIVMVPNCPSRRSRRRKDPFPSSLADSQLMWPLLPPTHQASRAATYCARNWALGHATSTVPKYSVLFMHRTISIF